MGGVVSTQRTDAPAAATAATAAALEQQEQVCAATGTSETKKTQTAKRAPDAPKVVGARVAALATKAQAFIAAMMSTDKCNLMTEDEESDAFLIRVPTSHVAG